MEQKEQEKVREDILKVLNKNPRGMSISDIFRKTSLTRDNIRISISYLIGAGKVEEVKHGTSKVYYII